MKKNLILTVLCFAVVITLVLPQSASAEEAPVPTLEVGDSWAMGTEMDIGEWAGPAITMFKLMAASEDDVAVDEANLDGSTAIWILSEVTSVTDTTYTIESDTAMSMELSGDMKITADMPVSGNYVNVEPPTEEKIITAELDLDCAVTVTGTSTFNADTMVLEKQTLDISGKINVQFKGDEIPMIKEDYQWNDGNETSTTNVSYSDFDVGAALVFDIELTMLFDDGFDIFNFPIEVDEMWEANSGVTISATYTGSLDVMGLPEDIEEEMFADETLKAIGIDGFPIIFEEISVPVYGGNGNINSLDVGEVSMYLECTGTKDITMADGTTSEVYVITTVNPYEHYMDNNPYNYTDYYNYSNYMSNYDGSYGGSPDLPMEFYYSPTEGFLVSFGLDSETTEGLEDSGLSGTGSSSVMSMAPVTKAEAEDGIGEITSYKSDISTSADPDDGMGSLILILALVGIVAVVGVLVLMKMKKPSVPSVQQGQVPPPPTDGAVPPMEGSTPPVDEGMASPPPPPMD